MQLDADRQARLHGIAPPRTMTSLAARPADEISTMISLLEAMEQEISAERRALHVVFDRIQAEVIRRYKSGQVPIETAFFAAMDQPLYGSAQLA